LRNHSPGGRIGCSVTLHPLNVCRAAGYNEFMESHLNRERFLKEGREFHKVFRGARKRPGVFTPVILQNIAAMGIEKYFMAVFAGRGTLPYNHTMTDFIEELRAFRPLGADMEADLRRFDELQSICSLDNIRMLEPEAADIELFARALDGAAALAEECAAGNQPQSAV